MTPRLPSDPRGPAAQRCGPGWLFVARPFLDWLLAFAERVDGRRRGIRPVTRDGYVAIECATYYGPRIRLRDGTCVGDGDPVVALHLRNARIRDAVEDGWNLSADSRSVPTWRASPSGRRTNPT